MTWLNADRKPAVLLAVAGLFGVALSWHLLGWEGIAGTSEYWATTHNDSAHSIAGLQYFMGEGWGWPLLDINSYGYPGGTNVVITDSVPLLAVVAKLFSGVLPAGFHYFGYWMTFCFGMQAVTVVGLLAVLGWRSYLAAVVGAGMALLQTALLARFFHVALLAQFLIVAALLIGVQALRSRNPNRQLVWFAALLASAFFVHLYLFAMVAVIATAFVIQLGCGGRLRWSTVWAWVLGLLVGSAALVAMSGVGAAARVTAGGFGTYSLNLLSLFSKQPDATGGQYEGFSYLGFGVIVLIALNLYASRPAIKRAFHTYRAAALAVVLMAVYALSATVWLGERLLLSLPQVGPMEWVGDRFRASGRFVWPLVYVLVVAAIYLTVRRFRPKVATAVLLGALALQALDMAGTVQVTRDVLAASEPQRLNGDAWANLIEQHSLLRVSQPGCVSPLGPEQLASAELERIAARAGVPITIAAVARQERACNQPGYRQPLVAGELRVVWTEDTNTSRGDDGAAFCAEFSLGTVCSLQPLSPTDVDRLEAAAPAEE